MADFCKQCSIELFGEDFEDLAQIAKEDQLLRCTCEGCGDAVVTGTGTCVSADCLRKHGSFKAIKEKDDEHSNKVY